MYISYRFRKRDWGKWKRRARLWAERELREELTISEAEEYVPVFSVEDEQRLKQMMSELERG